jgi:DNA-binding response OmpR family regulator
MREGYDVREAASGQQGQERWQTWQPHLLVVDWMLPGGSGLDLVRTVRAAGDRVPIIMVTARNEEPDIVVALEMGADDYLVKPVSLRQLVARMRAVARRTDLPHLPAADALRCGPLELDEAAHVVREDGVTLDLTLTEFRLLAALMRHPDRAFTRLQLLQAATGDYFEEYERTVDSHISHVRRKLAHPEVIQTLHGVGYKLVPPA